MKEINTLCLLIAILCSVNSFAQDSEPWTAAQLMNTEFLAEMIQSDAVDLPIIIAINPDGMHRLGYEAGIEGAIWFGESENPENLAKLQTFLQDEERDAEIVVYCGCCPFAMCPNIRPAFSLLNNMGFTHHKLLDLPRNIVDDWIEKGYPMKE